MLRLWWEVRESRELLMPGDIESVDFWEEWYSEESRERSRWSRKAGFAVSEMKQDMGVVNMGTWVVAGCSRFVYLSVFNSVAQIDRRLFS